MNGRFFGACFFIFGTKRSCCSIDDYSSILQQPHAKGTNLTQYDETINTYWRDQVRQYTAGEKSRDQAIADFKQQVADNLDVIVE